ncbi:MAG: hypothetical protein IT372_27825, partial [Polyangiaceae bacterium]|nr:hypothetical protein [Polyangiaceae bacterium]
MRQRSLLAFKPPWWPLIARGGVLLGGPLLLGLILDRHPLAVQIAGASYPASWPVAAVLFASWALMCGTLLRYHRFRSDNPLEYLNIDLAETDVGISESRVALRPWNSLEVVSCNLSAEGVRTGGAGLVLKVMYRMPWLRRAGFRAVVRAAVTNDQIVARFDASSEEVFPDEAREGLEAFLKSARASLSMHPGWTIVVTPGDLLLWLPDSPRPAEVARIMAGLASEWAHVERPRPVGYRDI